ncbi:Lrp/AsnC family transcriptional regulator [Alkalihalobacillus sp. LMS39]|uniref:Lrp/AsnC family transcriptional regulator n=1 Tax=Alkalihalobacillus sp. LMS39 TaxID=2924032 RepID=UPI001FB4CD79|nr:Lrp/AsnC family transcriptional regulator [Alkalihalobacillus sp. LMS39]UOE95591.1 Lrp/AsnC family transcriptional regulator [Alkalihalobacillus sp. LMS39]
MKGNIDSLDRGIIQLLSKDGRMSFTEIANRLDVTEKTVRSRYKNLVETGIIDVVGIVNPISLGLKVAAIIQLAAASNQLTNIVDQVKQYKEVRYVSLITGEYQVLLQVNMKTYEELTEFIKKINGIAGITKSNVIIQLEINKNTFDLS